MAQQLPPSDPPPLPWARYVGSSVGENPAQKPLSFQMVVCILASIIAGFSALILIRTFARPDPRYPDEQALAGLVAALSGAAAVLFGVWHRAAHNRPDKVPDVLAKLFPLTYVLDVGGAHLTTFGFQHGHRFRLVSLAQNLFNSTTRVREDFGPASLDVGPVEFHLPPAGVAMAVCDLAFPHLREPTPIHLFIAAFARSGDGRSRPGGERVRYGSRQELRGEGRRVLTLVASHHGAIVFHLAGALRSGRGESELAFLTTQGALRCMFAPRAAPSEPVAEPAGSGWRVENFWSPDMPLSLNQLEDRLRELFRS